MSSPTNNSSSEAVLRPRKPGRGIKVLLIAVLCGAVIELLFRTVIFPEWKSVSQARFEKHAVYGTFQSANLSVRRFNPPNYDVINTTNSLGFRDREEGFAEDLAGVWLAGASNSYGGFVADDKIFPARLQALGYKVANLASEGHSLAQQMLVVRHLVAQGYRPQAVVFEMTLNNVLRSYQKDIETIAAPLPSAGTKSVTEKSAAVVLGDSFARLRSEMTFKSVALKSKLINNSAFYCWLKVGINSIDLLRDLTLQWGLRADVALSDSVPPDLLRDIADNPHELQIRSTADFMAAASAWVSANMGVPFGIVVIPGHHQLNPERFETYMRHLGLPAKEYDPSRPYRKLVQALKNHNLNVLEMAPAMEAADTFFGFPDDGHTNAAGHALIASELAKWLKSTFGLDPRP